MNQPDRLALPSPARKPVPYLVVAAARPRTATPQRPIPAVPAAAAPAAGIGEVVHELRNFLAPMPHALEIVRRQPGGPDAERAIAVMQKQVESLQRLVTDLLDVSRMAAGKLQLSRAPCPLQDVARAAIDMCTPAAQARSQQLVLAGDAEPVVLHADALRLTQALANLLFNAIRHTPAHGSIRVQAGREGGQAVLRVQDEGSGMPAELCARAFEAGTQAREGDRGSLGVGLYLVRALAQAHGGTAEAASAGSGRGSTFTIRLPLPGGPAARSIHLHSAKPREEP